MVGIDPRLEPYRVLLADANRSLPLSVFCRDLGVSTPTAWRALKKLISHGTVEKEGAGRSTRYRLVETYEQSVRIPLGLDSQDIDEAVNEPLALRTPVRYRPEFVADYIPNVTRYLPRPTTDRLVQLGDMRTREIGMSAELKRLIERLTIDISFGSSRLEGISSTYLDTENLILRGEESVSVTDRRDIAMVLNHKSATQFVLENLEENASFIQIGFNLPTIGQVHTLLMTGIHPDEAEIGAPRRREVAIERSAYRPINLPTEITQSLNTVLKKCDEITDPFEQSFFALVHLAYLQPFADGNKRTSRMMANIPLLKADLCPISFIATPKPAYTSGLLGVYEMNRIEMLRDVYVSSYEQTAHRIHQDKNRQIAPTLLELRYNRQISAMVGDIIRNALSDNYLDTVKKTIAGFNDLDTNQKTDLLHIVLEKSRKVSIASRYPYKVSLDEFRVWDERRPFYLNTEVIPIPTRQH